MTEVTFTASEEWFRALARQVAATECRRVAERVAAAARSTAPVDTGAYRASIRVRTVPRRASGAAAIVEAADPKALLIESRTGTLARALRAAR